MFNYQILLYVIVNKSEVSIVKPLKVKVSITLDEEIVVIIKKLAETDDRSFSQYINCVLRKYIKGMEKRESQT